MKKKRFIKLLMGAGIPRDTAALAAKAAVIVGAPKAVVLANIVFMYAGFISLGYSVEAVNHGLLKATEEILQGGTCNA